MVGLIGHLENITTVQFFIGSARNAQSNVRDFQNNALWYTH